MLKKGKMYSLDGKVEEKHFMNVFKKKEAPNMMFYITLFSTEKSSKDFCDEWDYSCSDNIYRLERILPKARNNIDNYLSYYLGCYSDAIDIFYEEFEGTDGNIYGREYLTGLIFPICTYGDVCSKDLDIDIRKKKFKKHVEVYIEKTYSLKKDSMHKIVSFISGESLYEVKDGSNIVSQDDLDDYNLSSKEKKKIVDTITKLYSKNVFKNEVVEKIEVKTKNDNIVQSIETIIMERIEYLLEQLKKLDNDLYKKYKEKYNTLLNNEGNLLKIDSLNSTSLMLLESEIELEITYKKRNVNNLNEYINSLRIDYLNKLKGEEVTPISLKDLDRLYELFINIKKNYSISDQREFIKNISFLYLMELYENRDSISIEELNNSYCTDIIRSILINLIALIDSDVFENNMELELNNDINIEMLFNIIKSLKIKDKKQVKVLIR